MRIYSEWLPNSGYEHAMLSEIEYYSAGDMMRYKFFV
jgi:predicted transcriptional regulator YdeE